MCGAGPVSRRVPGGETQGRRLADHPKTGAQARQTPGEWVYVSTYGTCAGADRIMKIITGEYTHHSIEAYNPIGSFITQTRDTELYTEVWVKYIGEAEIPA